jgi:ribonuclease R
MGDKIRIKLISANLAKRQLDYEWVVAPVISIDDTIDKIKTRKKKG